VLGSDFYFILVAKFHHFEGEKKNWKKEYAVANSLL
jgi:hypothetical protein